MSHAETIRAYYAAWLRNDIDAVFDMCTDDLVAVNVPIGPINGKAAVREYFTKFSRGMSDKRYDIEQIVEAGDMAMVEGVENYTRNGKRVSLPYMSRFQFRDGKICEWRDYFDLQTILKQLGLPLDGSRPEKPKQAATS